MSRVGEALLKATDAYRINYEILGNSEPALHAHILPRYKTEPDEKRKFSAFASYDWKTSKPINFSESKDFMEKMKLLLLPFAE